MLSAPAVLQRRPESCPCSQGEFSERKREAVQAVYEVRPVPGPNNKLPGLEERADWGAST